jgi:stage V sporulation protein SpoVS
MMLDLSEMTNTELKQYISEHRNNPDSFAAAMAVVMSRRNPANLQPYPRDITNYQVEVEAILREKLNDSQHSIDMDR